MERAARLIKIFRSIEGFDLIENLNMLELLIIFTEIEDEEIAEAEEEGYGIGSSDMTFMYGRAIDDYCQTKGLPQRANYDTGRLMVV